MSDWENEDFDDVPAIAPIPVKTSKWDDEDQSESEVKDAWDASESDNESKPKVEAPKKKKTLKEKIAEREEEARRKKEEEEKKKAALEAELNETPAQRKARLERAVKESDFKNAQDLFGGMTISAPQDSLLSMDCKTKEDFEKFKNVLMDKIKTMDKSTFYGPFVTSLVTALVEPLNHNEVRKLSQVLQTVSLEKQKAQKAQTGKKKLGGVKLGSKGGTNFEREMYDSFAMDDEVEEPYAGPARGDDYDFM